MTSPSQVAVGRQREAALPGASSWVSASAGTGKTTVLTNRMLRLLLDGARPEMLLAITFTRAAAAEMENRLFRRLGEWAGMEDGPLSEDLERLTGERPPAETLAEARRLLARALECPGGMRIQTIHSFCQSLLASFPLEAGLAPHFRLLDEAEALALRREARAETFREAAGDDGPIGEAFATAVRSSSEMDLHKTLESLTADGVRLAGAVRRAGGVDAYVERIAGVLGAEPGDSERGAMTEALQGAKARRDGLARAAAALGHGSDTDRERGEAILAWLDLDESDPGLEAAWGTWSAAFLTQKGEPRKTLATKRAQMHDPGAAAALEAEAGRVQDFLDRLKRARVLETSAAYARLGAEEARRYGRLKRSRVAVDYNDLIERAGRLLTRREASDWILYKLDGGVDHILVDEAQDTSPAQWRVVEALAREFFAGQGSRDGIVRTVFAVGDSKQSIFRFQGADPASFARMRDRFRKRAADARLDWRPVSLDISFRSTRAVLEAVDAVANHAGPGLAEKGEAIVHVANRESAPGRVEVWPPVAPAEDDALPNAAVERLASLMAERIEGMTDASGPQGSPAVSPGDIMVLVRKRNPFMPYIARALRRRGVPVAGLDRMDLAAQPAVVDLVNLGRFLLLPQDDLVLANVLKGPLAGLERGISEKGLFALAHGRERSLWSELQRRRGESEEYERAAARLLRLLGRAEDSPPFELFSEALDGPDGARATLLSRLGADAAEAVEEFLVQALDHGKREISSLEGFLAWLDRERIEVKRDMEAMGSSVRIMTVHGAKGLEAPVVFVADRAGKPRFPAQVVWGKGDTAIRIHPKNRRDPVSDRLVEEQEERDWEEYRRLLYVAMTRARDRLVVASWWKKPTDSEEHWPAMVRGPLSQAPGVEADRGFPLENAEHPCLVLDRPGKERPEPAAGRGEGTAELPPWIDRAVPRPRQRRRAAPSGRGGPAHDPAAAARGVFAHLLLEHLPDTAPAGREARARGLAERFGNEALPEATRDEVTEKVLAVLSDPAFAKVFGPGSEAEVEIAGRIGGADVQGQIDRLAVGEEEVLAVEFKSGRPALSWAGAPEAHRRQLSDYLSMLEGVYPERTVRGALLYLERPELLEAPPAPKASPT